ncbi:MAG: diphosphate--fructose-6-phosphate 1-phosphotransferase [Thermodesulfovibrionia bacterium]|nr:diphosphate--fructose-6-phosphate 1-phosphotransferase [Thermodesulfovibrionia bacterium]
MNKTLAIVVGGGPAPGINGVISAATIEAASKGIKVIGIMDGFKWLFQGDTSKILHLTEKNAWDIHNRGGSVLRTSREFPGNPRKQFENMIKALKALNIKFLITIGGDGTAYMARKIEEKTRGFLSIVHVPKTIDNDLPLPGGAATFGFETARHWGAELIENIIEDARTTGRWYFITTMGRHTGHLALGIGKAAGATITLIPEEFREKKLKFSKVADILEGSIIKRLAQRHPHGVAILAEGIADKIDVRELSKYEHPGKDEMGEVRLSEIQLGRILEQSVTRSLESRDIKIKIIFKNIGYELRAADPIPLDAEYTRNLGYSAVKFLLNGRTGAMITFYEGRLKAIPFRKMIDPVTKRTKLRYVDIKSEPYMVGREYMVRLEKEDFIPKNLSRLARAGRMSVAEFRKRFSYLV